jgi:hypothetical protein
MDEELDEVPPPEPPPGELEQPARTVNKTVPDIKIQVQNTFNLNFIMIPPIIIVQLV